MEKNRLYILTRSDLSLPYQGVQAGHAVAQWLLDNKDQSWNNQYLIYLQTDNLDLWKMKLTDQNLPFSEFKEPDLDHLTTAIAINHNGNLFKKLKPIGV